MYVSNIKSGTSKEQVTTYCQYAGIQILSVEKLSSQRVILHNGKDRSVSPKLKIKYEKKDLFMSIDFWPKGVRVRGWWLPRKEAVEVGRLRVDSWGGEDRWFSTKDSESLRE